jgi:hypothetical protein
VASYDSTIAVDFCAAEKRSVRMVVRFGLIHDAATTVCSAEFLRQLSKLDKRFEWQAV